MTSKTTIGLLTAGLAFVALAPLAGAAVNDDTLSRSFVYVSGARAEMDGDGTGWLDASNPPNVCVASLRGVQTPLIGVFYYETLRVYTNLPGFVSPVTEPANTVFVPLACPAVLNPLCTAITSCGIYIQPTTVGAFARTIIPQDGLVCTQQSSFISCVVTASKWTIAACPWANASFVSGDVNKGFFAGTGLETLLMSRDITCSAYANAGYDVSFLLGSGGDLLSSGFDGVPANLLVPFGNGDDTSFVVQCLDVVYTTVDTSTPIPTITPNVPGGGVDWEQILDLDAPGGAGWIGDLGKQVGSGGATTLALAGLYNLGGNNNCDFTANTALPQCSDGINNDNDNEGADVQDKDCYSPAPVTGALYYNPLDNTESGGVPTSQEPGPPVLHVSGGDGLATLFMWEPVEESGPVDQWIVYRGTCSGCEIPVAELDGDAGSFFFDGYTDHGLTNGVTYYYQVVAANGASAGRRSTEAVVVPHPALVGAQSAGSMSCYPVQGAALGGVVDLQSANAGTAVLAADGSFNAGPGSDCTFEVAVNAAAVTWWGGVGTLSEPASSPCSAAFGQQCLASTRFDWSRPLGGVAFDIPYDLKVNGVTVASGVFRFYDPPAA